MNDFRRSAPALAILLMIALVFPAVSAAAATRVVNFDPLPLGTAFGSLAGTPVGQLIATQDSIDVFTTVHWSAGIAGYTQGLVEMAGSIGSGHLVALSAIGMSFDFHGTGDVSFAFRDLGGTVNLRVNGGPLFEVPNYLALDNVLVAPGVTAHVIAGAAGGTVVGSVNLTGLVRALVISGSELQVDDVTFVGASDTGNPGGMPIVNCDLLIDHETLALGTTWLAPAVAAGDIIFTEDGFDVALDRYSDGTQLFFSGATVVSATSTGRGHVLGLIESLAVYDLAAQGGQATKIEFFYSDAGLTGNLKINGNPTYIGDLMAAPAAIAPGVTLAVVATPNGLGRRVTLSGDITILKVGGADFEIDNICFTTGTGPVYGGCDKRVTADSQILGQVWDIGNSVPGTQIFSEDGIPVHVARLDTTGGLVFGRTSVGPASTHFGNGKVLWTEYMTVAYDLYGLGDVVQVSIDYRDAGSLANLQVNGGSVYSGDLSGLPLTVAPGVSATVAETVLPTARIGRIVLTGPVTALRLGGVDLALDNLCVRLNGPTSSGVADGDVPLPRLMAPVYPNPFNPSTQISFTLPTNDSVTLSVYDMQGNLVRTLLRQEMAAGPHLATWRGRNDAGYSVGSGVYLARLQVGTRVETQKLALIK